MKPTHVFSAVFKGERIRWSRRVVRHQKTQCPMCGSLAVAYAFEGIPNAYLSCTNGGCGCYCGIETFHRIVETDLAKEAPKELEREKGDAYESRIH